MIKKSLIALGLAFALAACGAHTSDHVTINTNDIQYVQDSRTDLCYAFVGTSQTSIGESTSLSMTNVPCTAEVMRLVPVTQ